MVDPFFFFSFLILEDGKAGAHLDQCQLLGRHFPSIPSSGAACNY